MTGCDLFVNLVLRLRHYGDAAVLWVLIKERAEVRELKTTSMLISHVQLAGTVDRMSAHRSFKNLQAKGLIKVRVHRKTATLITVDRVAVLDLLSTPLDERLPGLSQKTFPFLDNWAEDVRRVNVPGAAAMPRVEGSNCELVTSTSPSTSAG